MLPNSIIVVLILLIVFVYYKRDILKQMVSTDMMLPTNSFQEQLEQTADTVIKRLEEQINQLQYLLEEANEKITALDIKIQVANDILNKENNNVNKYLTQPINSDTITNTALGKNQISPMNIESYKDMGRKDKRSSIIDMADLGYDITEIAKATGISKGEIMLLLQLNKR